MKMINLLLIVWLAAWPRLMLSQTSSMNDMVDAGPHMMINWQETQSAELQGTVDLEKVKTRWDCVNNKDVSFNDPGGLTTKVTFPRPGYYLLRLSVIKKGEVIAVSDLMANVCQAGSHKDRLKDMIGLMTIGEKINQLGNESDAIPRLGLNKYNYWSEALHGILDVDATSFPQVIAMGSTWDPELLYTVASAISDEARIKHATTGKGLSYWSPTVNIARDPRWGRNEECYSEDPFLLSRMGVAFVKGMQGDDPYYLKTVSTPKHFIANNEESRRHSGSSDVDMRSLHEYYMPAFKSAVMEGGAYSVMCAYNELNQVPACGNYYLLTDLLRRQWGFKGYVVSDCGAIHDMVAGHQFFLTGAEAAARGIRAGCDLNCGNSYTAHLQEALDKGLITEADLDTALTHILSARFRLGEFDPPGLVPYADLPAEKLAGEEHAKLALHAARQAMVLLKNDGVLPVDPAQVKTIAVIGPNAGDCSLGIYSGFPQRCTSPLEGIEKAADAMGIKVNYAQGSELGGGLLKIIDNRYFGPVDDSGLKGMRGEFFSNMSLEGEPVITRIDSVVDFDFGGGSPAPGVSADQFSCRWTGTLIPPETRVYSLGTRTDDGARLYLDGELILNDWTEHGEKPNSVPVELEAGREYDIIFEHYDNQMGAAARLTWDLEAHDFEEARKVAGEADLVILVVGTSPGLTGEELDRKTIALPKIQQDLIREVASANPNIVLVLINGGPLALEGTEDYAKAILEAWYPGQEGGRAIADVLFGKVNPGGKLPQTFYRSDKQLPPFDNYDIIQFPRSYMYFTEPVLFPFGHGLSYTSFEYGDLKLASGELKKDGILKLSCTLTNAGDREGDEVVQVYVRDVEASVKVPVKQLKAFRRLHLGAGESREVAFEIPVSELRFYDIRTNDFLVEPGSFEVLIGSSSKDIRLKQAFTVAE